MSLEKANRDYVEGFYRSEAGLQSADPGVEFYRHHHDSQKNMFGTPSTPASFEGAGSPRWLAALFAVAAIAGVGALLGGGVQKPGSILNAVVSASVLLGAVAFFVAFRFVPRFWKPMLYFVVGFLVAIALKLAIGKALTYGPTEFYARAWLDSVKHVNSALSPLNEMLSLRAYFAELSGVISITVLQLLFFVFLFFAISLLPWARRRMSLVTAVIVFQFIIWLVPEILF